MLPGDNEVQRAIVWVNTRLENMTPEKILAVSDALELDYAAWRALLGEPTNLCYSGLLTRPERDLLERIHTTYPSASIAERYVFTVAIYEAHKVLRG